uniref:ANK_REP_REGION domain-containing protein n=1 Tax=Macrostomum lignano TaxID=282301 RepID=A0A1I8GKI4_9PLAT
MKKCGMHSSGDLLESMKLSIISRASFTREIRFSGCQAGSKYSVPCFSSMKKSRVFAWQSAITFWHSALSRVNPAELSSSCNSVLSCSSCARFSFLKCALCSSHVTRFACSCQSRPTVTVLDLYGCTELHKLLDELVVTCISCQHESSDSFAVWQCHHREEFNQRRKLKEALRFNIKAFYDVFVSERRSGEGALTVAISPPFCIENIQQRGHHDGSFSASCCRLSSPACCKEAAESAASSGHLEVVKFLVKTVADQSKRGQCCKEAAESAASRGHLEVVKFLVKTVADQSERDQCCKKAAKFAASKGHLQIVEFLVETVADQSERDQCCKGTAKFAALSAHLEVVQFLVEKVTDQSEKNQCCKNAAKFAARNGNLEVVKFLVKTVADQSERDQCCKGAAKFAALSAHLEVVNFLVETVADQKVVKFLLEKFAQQSERDKSCKEAAESASRNGHLEVVKFLVNTIADQSERDQCCKEAAESASRNGHLEVVKFLVKTIADQSERDQCCKEAVESAAWNGHFEVVNFLVKTIADQNPLFAAGSGLDAFAAFAGRDCSVIADSAWRGRFSACVSPPPGAGRAAFGREPRRLLSAMFLNTARTSSLQSAMPASVNRKDARTSSFAADGACIIFSGLLAAPGRRVLPDQLLICSSSLVKRACSSFRIRRLRFQVLLMHSSSGGHGLGGHGGGCSGSRERHRLRGVLPSGLHPLNDVALQCQEVRIQTVSVGVSVRQHIPQVVNLHPERCNLCMVCTRGLGDLFAQLDDRRVKAVGGRPGLAELLLQQAALVARTCGSVVSFAGSFFCIESSETSRKTDALKRMFFTTGPDIAGSLAERRRNGIMKSQFLRYARRCTFKEDFDEASSSLLGILKRQGHSVGLIRDAKKSALTQLGFYTDWQREFGFQDCGIQSCYLCKEHGQWGQVCPGSKSTKMIYRICQKVRYDSRNAVYAILCKACSGHCVYIGETGGALKVRLLAHLSDIRLAKDTPVSRHFCSFNHNIKDLRFMRLWYLSPELETNKEGAQRRGRDMEQKRINLLSTWTPAGLNTADSSRSACIP